MLASIEMGRQSEDKRAGQGKGEMRATRPFLLSLVPVSQSPSSTSVELLSALVPFGTCTPRRRRISFCGPSHDLLQLISVYLYICLVL